MKKYLIAAALVLCAPQPILAQEAEVFYVILDNTTNQCRVMAGSQLPTTQKARYKELGKYATVDEAKAALDSMIGRPVQKCDRKLLIAKKRVPNQERKSMVRLIAFAAFALAVATSAQAMSPPPLPQPDGISAEARYRGVARGHRYGVARGHRYGVARGYGHRRYGYGGYGRYGYRGYGYRGYRPGYGVARRQVRRCALWGAGHVCRRWVY